jgi:hypothetical protein
VILSVLLYAASVVYKACLSAMWSQCGCTRQCHEGLSGECRCSLYSYHFWGAAWCLTGVFLPP